jgi:hypothetical protein
VKLTNIQYASRADLDSANFLEFTYLAIEFADEAGATYAQAAV